jgi:hypothetical protein
VFSHALLNPLVELVFRDRFADATALVEMLNLDDDFFVACLRLPDYQFDPMSKVSSKRHQAFANECQAYGMRIRKLGRG